jgi:hypothetical protein
VKLKQELRLRASGGEPLPTSEHCSFPPPPKARILLCRGPVLWVLELPQDRLGFVVKTYLVFVLMWILRSVRGCVVIVELGFAGSCLDFFLGEGSQIPCGPCGLVYPTEPYNIFFVSIVFAA